MRKADATPQRSPNASLGVVANKRTDLFGHIDKQQLALGPQLEKKLEEIADDWRVHGNVRRLWQCDKSLWTNENGDHWLGWLKGAEDSEIASYVAFAQEVKQYGCRDAVLLGMGGSSLGPEVLAVAFGHQSGWPRLRILDSTVPEQIKVLENDLVLAKTLFIVSSKSRGTTEPNILTDYFFQKVADEVGPQQAERQFIAITDSGSALERRAKEQKFLRTFHGVATVGGRYSVLSAFGLVPTAIAGLDVARLVISRAMMRSCGPDVPPAQNPGVKLGIALGLSAARGRDKVTILTSPRIAAFGAWADLALEGDTNADHEFKLKSFEKAGHPVTRIEQNSPAHIVQEFFRFEIATATAGSVLGINPFDQPDVEASKVKTRELSSAFERSGALPEETPICSEGPLSLYTDEANALALRKAGADGSVESFLAAHFSHLVSGDYFALLAYLARDERNTSRLQQLRMAMRDRRRVATCLEFGPRFLHSTGQAYNGGPDCGVFLQVTAHNPEELAIPGHRATFGVVNAAQARGDFQVLLERGRRALRVHLSGDLDSGLTALKAALEHALT